jgi:tetratricopeptide (TPR) repeat protein
MSPLDTFDENIAEGSVSQEATEIEVHLAGVVFGPFSAQKIRQRLTEGLLMPTDRARFAHSGDWQTLLDVLAQAPPDPARAPVRSAPPVTTTTVSSLRKTGAIHRPPTSPLPTIPYTQQKSARAVSGVTPPDEAPSPILDPMPSAFTRLSAMAPTSTGPTSIGMRRTSRISLPPVAPPEKVATETSALTTEVPARPQPTTRMPQGPIMSPATSSLPAAHARPATTPLPPPPRRTGPLPQSNPGTRPLPVIPPLPMAGSNRTAPLGGLRSKIMARTASEPLKSPSPPEALRRTAAPLLTNRQSTMPLTRPIPSSTATLVPGKGTSRVKGPEKPSIADTRGFLKPKTPLLEPPAAAPETSTPPPETEAPARAESAPAAVPAPTATVPSPATSGSVHAVAAPVKTGPSLPGPIRAESAAPTTAGAAITAPNRSTRLIPASAIAASTMPPLSPEKPAKPVGKQTKTAGLSVVLPPRKSQALLTPPPRQERAAPIVATAKPAASQPAPTTPKVSPPAGVAPVSEFAPLPTAKKATAPVPTTPPATGLTITPSDRPKPTGAQAAITLGAPLSISKTPSGSTLGPGPATPATLSSVATAPAPKMPPSAGHTTTLISSVLGAGAATLLPRTGSLPPVETKPVTANPRPNEFPPIAEPDALAAQQLVARKKRARRHYRNLALVGVALIVFGFLAALGFHLLQQMWRAEQESAMPTYPSIPGGPPAETPQNVQPPPAPPAATPAPAAPADTSTAPAAVPAATPTEDPHVATLTASGKDKENLKDFDGAITDLNQALALNPKSLPALSLRAVALQAKNDLNGAVADDTAIITLDPNNAPAFAQRAYLKQTQGDVDGAVADYSRAIALDPKSYISLYNRGLIKEQKGDLDGAIADYNAALDLNPRLPGAYYNRGNVKSEKSDFDGAIADYTRALEINPRLAMAACNRGLAEQNTGNLDAAFLDYNQALSIDPNIAIAYYNRGLIKEQRDDLDGSIADSTKSLELDPNNVQAYYNRGVAQQAKGNLEMAKQDLLKFAELAPKNPYADYAHLYLWIIEVQQGQKQNADQALTTAMQGAWNSEPGALPSKIAGFLLDHISESDLMAAAASSDAKKDQGQHCEAWYFDGMKKLLTGDRLAGLDSLHRCLNTSQKDYCEYILAQAELQALGQD